MGLQIGATKVWEGTWQEISAELAALPPSQRVRLELLAGAGNTAAVRPPNRAMLDAMRGAEIVQQGMDPGPGGDSVALVREAREGAMWDDANH